MYKVGDRLLCKKGYKSVGYIIYYKGKEYEILNQNNDCYMVGVIGGNTDNDGFKCFYIDYELYDYFYTESKIIPKNRKSKLDKLDRLDFERGESIIRHNEFDLKRKLLSTYEYNDPIYHLIFDDVLIFDLSLEELKQKHNIGDNFGCTSLIDKE